MVGLQIVIVIVIKEMSVKKAVEDYKEKIVILRVEKGEKMCDFSTSIHL